ncbi:MAG: hypothetical protein ACE5JF_02020 [Anaerolineales bacterium]
MYGSGRVIGGIVLLVGLVLGALALGAVAYNAGVAQGVAGEALPAGEAGEISPYFYGIRGFGLHGPGSFMLFCLVIPFLFFLFFGVMKLIFAPWGMGMRHRRHGWGWKGNDEWRRRFEEEAAEWHRKAHEADEEKAEGGKA